MEPRVTEPAKRVRELVDRRALATGPGGADDHTSPLVRPSRVS